MTVIKWMYHKLEVISSNRSIFYFWQDVGGTVRSRLCNLLSAKFSVYSNTKENKQFFDDRRIEA